MVKKIAGFFLQDFWVSLIVLEGFVDGFLMIF